MTREEFIKKYKNDCRYYLDGYYIGCIDDFLTNIYNDHEAQLKAKDDEIRRLNNLYADTIKDLGDALIEIERLKADLNHHLKELGGKHKGGKYPTTYNGADVIQVLLEVFNDKKELEAQLKAKENDLERQDMIIKCLSMDLDNKEKLLKDKEEDLKLALDELVIERGIKEYLANE